MASGLTNQETITVGNETFPTPLLLGNISLLHRILEEVLEDWLRAVEPYQRQVDDADDDSAMMMAGATGFWELQPLLLKCLFSYAFFFVAADNAYGHLYAALNRANKNSGLNVQHDKPPRDTPFIEKIRLIRNNAIAHFPGRPSKKLSRLDAFAAMSWQPMSLGWSTGSRPDLEKLTFGAGHFGATDASGQRVESKDLEVPGVRVAHKHCLLYLEQYDKMCCDYLQALLAALSCKGGVP